MSNQFEEGAELLGCLLFPSAILVILILTKFLWNILWSL